MQGSEYFAALGSAALDYAIRDIKLTLESFKDDPVAVDKYTNQLHAALGEKRKREGKHLCPTCKRPL